jgi:serine/threonine protein kinase
MTTPDAATLGQQALRLGLLTEPQLEEGREEVGPRHSDPEPLLLALERKGYLTPWQSGKLRRGDLDGYFLGGYRILYKIASGSFGRVFRAADPSSGRQVAIKVLRRRWTENPQQVELFLREGRVGMTLQHPNIVEVLAVSHDPASGQYYMVMEFVEGGNLREILQIRKQLSPAETLRILEEAAAGLAYAYIRGVTHRDMKLSNLLMSSQGSIKLVDFGLARLFSITRPDEDQNQKVDRTVDYAGLEKATGVKPGDIRSDIYFLGCVGYHLLSGRSPLELTRSRSARMQKARFDSVAPLRPELYGAPPAMGSLIETMMSLDPRQRFQTPAQLAESIATLRREIGGSFLPEGVPQPPPAPKSLFLVEGSQKWQGRLRDGFKKLGYRVFLSGDPERAVERFHMQPFDALVVNGGSTGDAGRSAFVRILFEARKRNLPCVGILFVKEDLAKWAAEIPPGPNLAVITQPATIKQLHTKLQELAAQGRDGQARSMPS